MPLALSAMRVELNDLHDYENYLVTIGYNEITE